MIGWPVPPVILTTNILKSAQMAGMVERLGPIIRLNGSEISTEMWAAGISHLQKCLLTYIKVI